MATTGLRPDPNQSSDGLRREVLLPGHQSNGVAAMIVAAMFMFLTVAGAAFALQARMSACPYEKQEPSRVQVNSPDDCGRVTVIRRNGTTVTVHRPACD